MFLAEYCILCEGSRLQNEGRILLLISLPAESDDRLAEDKDKYLGRLIHIALAVSRKCITFAARNKPRKRMRYFVKCKAPASSLTFG